MKPCACATKFSSLQVSQTRRPGHTSSHLPSMANPHSAHLKQPTWNTRAPSLLHMPWTARSQSTHEGNAAFMQASQKNCPSSPRPGFQYVVSDGRKGVPHVPHVVGCSALAFASASSAQASTHVLPIVGAEDRTSLLEGRLALPATTRPRGRGCLDRDDAAQARKHLVVFGGPEDLLTRPEASVADAAAFVPRDQCSCRARAAKQIAFLRASVRSLPCKEARHATGALSRPLGQKCPQGANRADAGRRICR
eukprot:CAMPEP_0117541656 /NCGR_PEP_ID=MMETSP0784-20121206/44132_1 /TAXON_ID=39447 /ORGANISM="" /LENGTH=250 /DNA_ID=CAMNT_0005338359 /DNA_START=8 /DNA_END=755 /DNA_ORIENTATION=+